MDLKITPSGQTIVKPTALGPGANTDTKLLIYGLFQKGRVLAQDGYDGQDTVAELKAMEGVAFLQKPYRARTLLGKIATVLEGVSASQES